MRILKGLTLLGGTIALVLAAQATAAGPATVPHVYTVGVLSVPGVDTGLVLGNGQSVTVTATGRVCPWGDNTCVGPNGDSSFPTSVGGFELPGAPAWGLIGRVGNGPWVHVGSGSTTLAGSGVLVFAMNDNYYPDNLGSFEVTVTVTSQCWPGWGYGDLNHYHCGPPGLANKPPPPGQSSQATQGSSGEHDPPANGHSGEHGNPPPNGNPKNK
jgi:hypothetical protein